MKLLKIENNQGFFLEEAESYLPVDKINKEHLLSLVNLTLNEEEVEFDEYDADALGNQAHQIVYQDVHQKLSDLYGKRQEFIDDTDTLYLEDYQKYQQDIQGEE